MNMIVSGTATRANTTNQRSSMLVDFVNSIKNSLINVRRRAAGAEERELPTVRNTNIPAQVALAGPANINELMFGSPYFWVHAMLRSHPGLPNQQGRG
jgi:hypothetical protein